MKKTSIVFLSIIFVIMNIFPSFAAVATPSTASASNALPMDEYFETDAFDTLPLISPLALGDSSDIANTVDYSYTRLQLGYYDMSGTLHYYQYTIDDDGSFTVSRPSDFVSGSSLNFIMLSGALPPAGKYDFDFSVGFDVGGHTITGAGVYSNKDYANAAQIGTGTNVSFSDIGGDCVIETSVDVNSGLTRIYVSIGVSGFSMPNSGACKFEFNRISSSSDTAVDTAGSGMSDASQDTADNTAQIADNTQTIADNQAEIMDTIREQVQYITLQLEAFWNQLAGEFTNLFDKMNDQLSSLLSGITEQTEEIVDHLGDVQTEIDQSTTEINNNIDQSTNEITNGYDNSDLTNAANNYHQADQNLETAQDSAWEQGYSHVNDFDFGEFSFSPGVMAALVFCGDFLQDVFLGISFFNLPITIGLTLLFGLMIIGYYRYH